MANENFRPPESFQSNTERTLVLVDFSNLMYRAWYVAGERRWVAMCKFFDMLRVCVRKSKQPGIPLQVIFAGESKSTLKRTKLFEQKLVEKYGPEKAKEIPGYKGTRVHNTKPSFAEFRRDLEETLEAIGYSVLRFPGAEADDVIATIVARNCHRCFCKTPCENCDCALKYKTDVVIFSGDHDMQQLLAWDRVLIYRAPGVFVDKLSFEVNYGIPVVKYGVYKALIGDKSDNIAGVEGFGPVKAKLAINANTVAEDIWELGGEKAAEQFKLALELVKLDTNLMDMCIDDMYMGVPQIDEGVTKFLDERVVFEIKRLIEEF